jgi:hypothetical protein
MVLAPADKARIDGRTRLIVSVPPLAQIDTSLEAVIMGVGESIFQHLLARRESQRQYQFDFMPPTLDVRPHTLTLDTEAATIYVVADDFGKHGLMLDSLRLTGLGVSQTEDSADRLMRLVESIVVDVECPYGPIKCIENDERLTRAVLRTDPTDDGCFFEIVVGGGNEAELRHYTVSPASRERTHTVVNLGRRVFEKMADGLANAFRNAQPDAILS